MNWRKFFILVNLCLASALLYAKEPGSCAVFFETLGKPFKNWNEVRKLKQELKELTKDWEGKERVVKFLQNFILNRPQAEEEFLKQAIKDLNFNREYIVKEFGPKAFEQADRLLAKLENQPELLSSLTTREKQLLDEISLRSLIDYRIEYYAATAFDPHVKLASYRVEEIYAHLKVVMTEHQLAKAKGMDLNEIEKEWKEIEALTLKARQALQDKKEVNKKYLRETDEAERKMRKIEVVYPDAKNSTFYGTSWSIYDEKGKRLTHTQIETDRKKLAEDLKNGALQKEIEKQNQQNR